MKPRYDPRVFLALTISPGNKQRLGALQALFRPALPSWHFIPLENFHVTLRFLGEMPEDDIDAFDAACRTLAPSLPPFTLEWDSIDYFGAAKSARVLFAAARPSTELARLVQALEHIPPVPERERREFTPHITLAKARSQLDALSVRQSTAVLSKLREQKKVSNQPVDFNVTSVHLDFVLMETVWVGRSVEYLVRQRYPFAAQSGDLTAQEI
jgi:2'-5' RNA ligase